MAVILPKTHATSWPGPLFFLAGPVRGGGDWQSHACEYLEDEYGGEFCAAIPMRYPPHHPMHSRTCPADPSAPVFDRQMAWERHYLARAGLRSFGTRGCLLFWLGEESKDTPHPGPEPYAMDSRREIAEWYTRLEYRHDDVRLVVGAAPGFYGLDQIQRCLNESNGAAFTIHTSIADTVQAAIALAV